MNLSSWSPLQFKHWWILSNNNVPKWCSCVKQKVMKGRLSLFGILWVLSLFLVCQAVEGQGV